MLSPPHKLTCAVLHPDAVVWDVWSWAPAHRSSPYWCRRSPLNQRQSKQCFNAQVCDKTLISISHWTGSYRGRFLLKGDLSIVIHPPLLLPLLLNVDSCCSQLPALLQSGQPSKTKSPEMSLVLEQTSVGLTASAERLTWPPPAASLGPFSWLSCPECWPDELGPLTASPAHLFK